MLIETTKRYQQHNNNNTQVDANRFKHFTLAHNVFSHVSFQMKKNDTRFVTKYRQRRRHRRRRRRRPSNRMSLLAYAERMKEKEKKNNINDKPGIQNVTTNELMPYMNTTRHEKREEQVEEEAAAKESVSFFVLRSSFDFFCHLEYRKSERDEL